MNLRLYFRKKNVLNFYPLCWTSLVLKIPSTLQTFTFQMRALSGNISKISQINTQLQPQTEERKRTIEKKNFQILREDKSDSKQLI